MVVRNLSERCDFCSSGFSVGDCAANGARVSVWPLVDAVLIDSAAISRSFVLSTLPDGLRGSFSIATIRRGTL